MAAIIDEKIFCCHGGLSPDLQNMEQIRRLMRPTDVPDTGLLCDLLWSDPDKDVHGWGENDRGVSFTFGADVVSKFLRKHEMDLICRAHQVSLKNIQIFKFNLYKYIFLYYLLFFRLLKMVMNSFQDDNWSHYFLHPIIVENLIMLVV